MAEFQDSDMLIVKSTALAFEFMNKFGSPKQFLNISTHNASLDSLSTRRNTTRGLVYQRICVAIC